MFAKFGARFAVRQRTVTITNNHVLSYHHYDRLVELKKDFTELQIFSKPKPLYVTAY